MQEHVANVDPPGCENCSTAPLHPFVVPGRTQMWRCPSCGLYQKGQPPALAIYETSSYHDGYMLAMQRKVRTACVRLGRARKFIDHPAPRLLDIGCSVGAVVMAAERLGWPAFGVDISRTAVRSCRERGLQCKQYDGSRLPYGDASFDLVTAWHVIEHVMDVESTMRDWFRVLRPGGVLALETPNAGCWKARILGSKYRRFWPADHIYAFTRSTLEPFLSRTGFELLSSPYVVPTRAVNPRMQAYSLAYQGCHAISRATGFGKSFQAFARRPVDMAQRRTMAA